MTKVNITETEIYAYGHSNAPRNEQDNDLVCCAVSTLMCTLAREVEKHWLSGNTKAYPLVELKAGDSIVYCEPTRRAKKVVEETFSTIANGFRGLAEQYPDYIKII